MAYLYQVNFEKKFVSGILSGRRYPGAFIRFATWQDAETFRKQCDGKTVVHSASGDDYIREYAILSAIEPMRA